MVTQGHVHRSAYAVLLVCSVLLAMAAGTYHSWLISAPDALLSQGSQQHVHSCSACSAVDNFERLVSMPQWLLPCLQRLCVMTIQWP